MQPLELFDTLLSPDAIVQIGHGDCSVCSLWDTTRACNCAIAQQPDRRDFAAKPSTARTHPLRDLAAPRFPIAVRHGDVFGFALARCSAGAPGIAVADGECPTGIHEPEHHRAIGIVTVSERVQAHGRRTRICGSGGDAYRIASSAASRYARRDQWAVRSMYTLPLETQE